ncbi:hypothetical protein SAMN05443432_104386 [Roseovarius litoreus]|uniref:DUF6455 domain-containing protein n=2 Tax=Rhodobacterales TaxID=204455 RepID=A0A1M7G086_9RHOB|nr:hypothetical protein SAMN05443432_104386 [Roseovarius litoreus]
MTQVKDKRAALRYPLCQALTDQGCPNMEALMPENTTLKRHAALVDRMANTVGIDLEEKLMAGMLDVDTIGDAVLNCTGCSSPGDCERWLDAHSHGADAPPSICRNTELFERLQAGKHA